MHTRTKLFVLLIILNIFNSNDARISFDEYIEEVELIAGPSINKRARTDNGSKMDQALEKLMEINEKDESEFIAFGRSVGLQLEKFPEEESYPCMDAIQKLLTQYKLKILNKQKQLETSNEFHRKTSTPIIQSIDITRLHDISEYSGFLNSANSDAEINLSFEC